MRIQPNPWLGVLIVVGYLTIVFTLWAVLDVDYASVGETTESVVSGIIIPVGIGGLYLLVVGLTTGWLSSALREKVTVPRWPLVVPALMLGVALVGLFSVNWGALSPAFLGLLALGTLLVGWSEEVATRGLLIVGLRGGLSEVWVWFFSCLVFGLLHLPNALFGAQLGSTLFQVGFAFLAGTALYILRRTTGYLILAILVHAVWDFSTFSLAASGGTNALGGVAYYVVFLLAIICVVPVLRHSRARIAGANTLDTN